MKMLSAVVMTGLLAGFTAAPVQAYELDGSKWPEGQSAFHYDLRYKGSASSPSGKSWNSAFRHAANAWNDQTAFRFTLDTQACLRPRDRFWDIPVPKIDSAFDNLFVPQPSWSPSTT
ncbi:hypothetical protein, partial [Thiolapillus sp.]|uniref:hypothetical protein n=1 Tax=Thiolapillus sp. TaxID=2017437 RepID=UPI003AF576B4